MAKKKKSPCVWAWGKPNYYRLLKKKNRGNASHAKGLPNFVARNQENQGRYFLDRKFYYQVIIT